MPFSLTDCLIYYCFTSEPTSHSAFLDVTVTADLMQVQFFRDDLSLLYNLTIFSGSSGFDPDYGLPGSRSSSPTESPSETPLNFESPNDSGVTMPELSSPQLDSALLPFTSPLIGPIPVRPQSGGKCKVDNAGQGTCVPWTSRCIYGGVAFANKCPNNEYCCVFATASTLTWPVMTFVSFFVVLLVLG